MSVFTPITADQLRHWLVGYPVGKLIDFKGIEAGIDNSNFFVTTEDGEFVLTLFERLTDSEVDYYLRLMTFLGRSLPAARPVVDRQGRLCRPLAGKLAALIVKLPGRSLTTPSSPVCEQIGEMLARLHLAGKDFPDDRPHPRTLDWCLSTAVAVEPCLTDTDRALLNRELQFQQAQRYDALPSGIVHADLFRDNVLFDAGHVSGILDFYFAGRGCWLFDLAVTANDWCLRDGVLDSDLFSALVRGYERLRSLTTDEKSGWPAMCRQAALRFWLSRLYDKHFPRDGHMVLCHDPAHFQRLLSRHIASPVEWPGASIPS